MIEGVWGVLAECSGKRAVCGGDDNRIQFRGKSKAGAAEVETCILQRDTAAFMDGKSTVF